MSEVLCTIRLGRETLRIVQLGSEMARAILRVLAALLAVARADDAMANFKKQFPQFAGADVEQVKPPAWISGSIWRIRLLSVLTQIFENLLWKVCAEFQINFVRICENSYMVIGLSILYQQLQLAVSI